MSTKQIVLLAIPLAAIYLALLVAGLRDWSRRRSFRLLPRYAWLAVIALVSTVGPILYFLLGRGEESPDDGGEEP